MDWETGSAGPSRSRGTSFMDRLTGTPAPATSEFGDHAPTSELDYGRTGAGSSNVAEWGSAHDVFSQEQLEATEEEDDLRALERAWVKERGVPALLAWEGELVDAVLDKVEQQAKMLALLRADPATSEEEHFRLVLVQTEMERAKYVVRSYVRARLHKVEKYAKHALAAAPHLLSGAERQHAGRYGALLDAHFRAAVLDSLPAWLQGTDDTGNDGVSMVPAPDPRGIVLVYCAKDCGEVALERGQSALLARGTTHLLQWAAVERWVALGWAQVL